MPVSTEHEAPLELFRRYPELVPRLLRDVFSAPMPERITVREVPASFNQTPVPERRSDGALVLEDDGGRPVAGVIVEVQRKVDASKHFSWPQYAASLHAQVRCPTYLLVIALTEPVARWAAEPIPTFVPGSRFAPLVIGPGQVPPISSLEHAQHNPAYSVLSALLHIHDETGEQVAFNAVYALYNSGASHDDGMNRIWWLLGILDGIVGLSKLASVERFLMLNTPKGSYEPKTPEFRAWAEAQWKLAAAEKAAIARAEAEAILLVLAARNLSVSDVQRRQILDCADRETLDRWVTRAATAQKTEDLFAAQ